ncbi:MAG TPA: hypothetical protein VKX28_17010 [Xanthobacteraceae bacterium]|nr:hypothetical protein [Xanthobacteraceae bacterium]
MPADARNLTGVWQGLYTYPNGESVSFVATLIDSGGALSGSTHEPCATTVAAGGTLYATLAGTRSGTAVEFRKIYDGKVPRYRAVDYAGTLNADATEVEGRWIIRGIWSGKFLMIRPARHAESLESKAAQRA